LHLAVELGLHRFDFAPFQFAYPFPYRAALLEADLEALGVSLATLTDLRIRIFEIFRRIHGPEEFGGGVGAGLTIARKIVERHGGRMWVESHVARGSTFYFTLGREAPR
jgi:hypothetical protein